MPDYEQSRLVPLDQHSAEHKVGFKSPPVHSRFKPGTSGNPSGRAKGNANFKTIFNKILREEVSLREGSNVRTISKAEAVLRGVVVGALRGDSRSILMLMRMAEQAGGFQEESAGITKIERVIVSWQHPEDDSAQQAETMDE